MNRILIPILAFVLLITLTGSVFIVHEGEAALVIQLGEAKRAPITEAGLHFKIPFVDEVRRFDARILSWDGDPERIPVKDDKFIFVDTFARWRISDPLQFYNAVQNERGAQSRLDDILDGSVRDVVSTHFLLELVRTSDRPLDSSRLGGGGAGEVPGEGAPTVAGVGDNDTLVGDVVADLSVPGKRLKVRQDIFEICERKLGELELGIELIDLRIKRIDYTPQVEKEVYSRMISQQEQVAERYRAQGQGKKAEIAGLTNQEQKRIESESYRKAQEILGEAEAESTRIYAEAYDQDAEFYRFLKSLETYETILGSQDVLLLSTDSDLFRYLESRR